MTIDTLGGLTNSDQCSTLVLKIGSALLVNADGDPRRAWLDGLVSEIAEMRARGQNVIVVSSGAIALGAARLKMPKGGRASLSDAQASASVGQIALARLWSDVLEGHDIPAAQMLVTLDDLEERKRYLNASSTLSRLREAGVVAVVNENDSVATEEIRFGDNDRLAARIGQAAGADAVLLLSDVDGLYDRDPDEAEAKLIATVEGVSPEIIAMATVESSSGMGSGGMLAKLQAARIAERAGITLAIINGTQDRPIAAAIKADRGTLFLPQRSDTARKAWLGGRLAPEGVLTVDGGCVEALGNGASLLAAGLTEVEGEFERGALVSIHGSKGERLGQGLVEYSADECRAILGLREGDQAAKLGYTPRAAVVHRDHMVHL
ncbi:glutamate 5-kinase [Pontixanthobacter aestiaquae]|uniref:Glutamate 5-kinase n=1 Tax=Pontixanthobacter aestiaquae TaxID=1509367 RepID=A0A844Z6Q0_9SPHN|nr:glutamate 5-kinase [Pontixanthobacter aestiaquae]MDN3646005.1 glutamate 5-kinase [Pontixanthobacter aestiaquae]MXO83002.1 glutamate 5-kinase [Pontixanthobacter aestiaquae]